jgi:nuclear pore complex protein Nup62
MKVLIWGLSVDKFDHVQCKLVIKMLIWDYFQRLEHELDFVASQQSELEEILRPLEEPLAGAPPPDAERERIYSLAETLDAQLQRMSDDLREVIDHINSANKSQDESEPLVQISRVLNAHMVKIMGIKNQNF